jgi:hypothetical protein
MEQAARAAGLFAARDYAGCTAVLQQLRSEHEMDPQVIECLNNRTLMHPTIHRLPLQLGFGRIITSASPVG